MARADNRYGLVAMLLHWTIAILLLTNIGIAWVFDDMKGVAKLDLIQVHKSLGITILLLSLVRLAWRLTHKPPPFSAHLKAWERGLAHGVHWLFYVFMIGMPLTGWAMVSASARIKVFPITMFGLFDWPAIAPLSNLPKAQMHQVHEAFEVVHTGALLWAGYALIILHVLGALKHQFLDKDNELGRMIGFLPAPGRREG
jgi:cytochrome b561